MVRCFDLVEPHHQNIGNAIRSVETSLINSSTQQMWSLHRQPSSHGMRMERWIQRSRPQRLRSIWPAPWSETMALAKWIAASGDENGGYRKSGSVCYVNCIENKPLKQPGHTITLTNAQPTSATPLPRQLNPQKKKIPSLF